MWDTSVLRCGSHRYIDDRPTADGTIPEFAESCGSRAVNQKWSMAIYFEMHRSVKRNMQRCRKRFVEFPLPSILLLIFINY